VRWRGELLQNAAARLAKKPGKKRADDLRGEPPPEALARLQGEGE
jgi:hypothetical protein